MQDLLGLYDDINYCSKVWGHLKILLHKIDQKYSVDIVKLVNDHCS